MYEITVNDDDGVVFHERCRSFFLPVFDIEGGEHGTLFGVDGIWDNEVRANLVASFRPVGRVRSECRVLRERRRSVARLVQDYVRVREDV